MIIWNTFTMQAKAMCIYVSTTAKTQWKCIEDRCHKKFYGLLFLKFLKFVRKSQQSQCML